MLNKKIILIAIAIVLVVGAAVAYAAVRGDDGTSGASQEAATVETARTQTTPTTATTETTPETEPSPKPDTPGDSFPQPPAPAIPPEPFDTSGLAYLSASVTAQQSFSDDDSIDILFYVQGPSYFTVQEKVSGSWITLEEGIYYPGTGGLLASQLAPGEESKTVRLLEIENDQYVAVTGEFTVLRADVDAAGGITTYSD